MLLSNRRFTIGRCSQLCRRTQPFLSAQFLSSIPITSPILLSLGTTPQRVQMEPGCQTACCAWDLQSQIYSIFDIYCQALFNSSFPAIPLSYPSTALATPLCPLLLSPARGLESAAAGLSTAQPSSGLIYLRLQKSILLSLTDISSAHCTYFTVHM